jgi:hypothetical protein
VTCKCALSYFLCLLSMQLEAHTWLLCNPLKRIMHPTVRTCMCMLACSSVSVGIALLLLGASLSLCCLPRGSAFQHRSGVQADSMGVCEALAAWARAAELGDESDSDDEDAAVNDTNGASQRGHCPVLPLCQWDKLSCKFRLLAT